MNISEEDRGANATRAEGLSHLFPKKCAATTTRHSWAGMWHWEPEQYLMAVGTRKGCESAVQSVWKAKSLPVPGIPEESRPTAIKNLFSSIQVFNFSPGSLEINTHQRQKPGVLALALLLAHTGFVSLYTGPWHSEMEDVELLCQTGHPTHLQCRPGPGREPWEPCTKSPLEMLPLSPDYMSLV